MISTELQRLNMVESQIRPSDVIDRRVIAAMRDVERERFVMKDNRSVAYVDEVIPLSNGRVLLPPRTLSKMVQHLELRQDDLVLDVGCGTGYSTAVISHIAQTVVGLESCEKLAAQATAAISDARIDNAVVVVGALPDGHVEEGPYNAILLNGAIYSLDMHLLNQLKDGGRLVAIQIEEGYGRVRQWRRFGSNFDSRQVFDAVAPILPGFELTQKFHFQL